MKALLGLGAVLATGATFLGARNLMTCPGSACGGATPTAVAPAMASVSATASACPVTDGPSCCSTPSYAAILTQSTPEAPSCGSEACESTPRQPAVAVAESSLHAIVGDGSSTDTHP
jgi:hypothetical protein